MTPIGFYIIEICFLYGFAIVKYFYIKYGNYTISNEIKVKSYNKGFSSRPIILFIFINSCILFNVDASSFIIDYDWTKPYMIEFLIRPWDKFLTSAFHPTMFNPFMKNYYVEDRYKYDQGDWGLPFDLKLHQFFIVLWWFWLFNKVALNLVRQYKKFIF